MLCNLTENVFWDLSVDHCFLCFFVALFSFFLCCIVFFLSLLHCFLSFFVALFSFFLCCIVSFISLLHCFLYFFVALFSLFLCCIVFFLSLLHCFLSFFLCLQSNVCIDRNDSSNTNSIGWKHDAKFPGRRNSAESSI